MLTCRLVKGMILIGARDETKYLGKVIVSGVLAHKESSDECRGNSAESF